jgi:hypothetical protein
MLYLFCINSLEIQEQQTATPLGLQPENGCQYDKKVLILEWKPNHKPQPKPVHALEEEDIQVQLKYFSTNS